MATDVWVTCPGCRTLSAGFDRPCHHCQQELDWLEKYQPFGAALVESVESWGVVVRISCEWSGGSTELSGAVDDGLEITTGDGTTWNFRVEGPPYRLVVSKNGKRGKFHTEPPWHDIQSGFRYSARLEAGCPSTEPPVVKLALDDSHPLTGNTTSQLGRKDEPGEQRNLSVPDNQIDLEHCRIVRHGDDEHASYWIVDLGTENGTFVNRDRVSVKRLYGGDFIQLGSYAWILNEHDGFLVPARPTQGVQVQLQDVSVRKRLTRIEHLKIPEDSTGRFVALVGKSGVGKSTLMSTILGELGFEPGGRVQAGDFDILKNREEFRRQLGYVPQKTTLHPDLTLEELIEFSSEMRGTTAKKKEIRQLLHRLDVPEKRWKARHAELSGGQKKRVQIATSLIAHPTLLLADEPGSGLDHGREHALLQLLRSLCFQGCTVIVVTHGLSHLGVFDRVILMGDGGEDGGRICFDGTPGELKESIPTRNFLDLDLEDPPDNSSQELQAPLKEPARKNLSFSGLVQSLRVSGQQCGTLFRREVHQIWNRDLFRPRYLEQRIPRWIPNRARRWLKKAAGKACLPWLMLPILVVPLFFAVAVSTAAPPDNRSLLGFLSILSCIWMGASLSLLAIVDERSVFDFERLLYLRLLPYVFAKSMFLWLLSAVQTVVFFGLLWSLRSQPKSMLYETGWSAFYLLLVGWAAVGMGLLISGLAGRRTSVANFILPLVMITQIVFSAFIVGQGDLPLEVTYGEFHSHPCEGMPDCPLRVHRRKTLSREGGVLDEKGRLNVKVVDKQGRPRVGVNVDFQQGAKVVGQYTTDKQGRFSATGLSTGLHKLTASTAKQPGKDGPAIQRFRVSTRVAGHRPPETTIVLVTETQTENDETADIIDRITTHLPGNEWLCDDCRKFSFDARSFTAGSAIPAPEELRNRLSTIVRDQDHLKGKKFNDHVKESNAELPDIWATRFSFLTLSRFGDVALRSFAYSKPPDETRTECLYSTWEHESRATLVRMMLVFPLLTCGVLWLQGGTGLGRRLKRAWRRLGKTKRPDIT